MTGGRLSDKGGGLYRQMEVITMAIAVILVGVCAVALVFLGIFFVLGLAFFVASSF